MLQALDLLAEQINQLAPDFVAAVDPLGKKLEGDPTVMFSAMVGTNELYQHFMQGGRSFICLQSV